MKLIVFILTATIHLAIGAAGFLMLLLALNGYSEAQATPSLIFFIVAGIASALLLGFVSANVANRLVEKRSFSKRGASVVAIFGFAIIGFVLLVVNSVAAVFLAEVVRSMP